jgi:hypothetical protein
MELRRYVIRDTISPFEENELNYRLRGTRQAIMKRGYPNGKDADECIVIYALFQNGDAPE